jgi:hypothetical protein
MMGAGVCARHMGVSTAFMSHDVGRFPLQPACSRALLRLPLTSERAPVALTAAMLAMPRLPSEQEEDELDELPPIDGDAGDDPETAADLDDVGGPEANDAGAASPLDDSTGEDDPLDAAALDGLEVDEAAGGWLDEAVDSPDLDLGDTALIDAGEEGSSLEDSEEPPAPDEDFGVGEGAERTSLDLAEEGPVNADEELRDEDLPALDADDSPEEEGKAEDDGLLDERVVGDEPLGLPWAADPWTRVGPPLGLSGVGLPRGITAIACAARGALVAGRPASGGHELIRVDLEGSRQVLSAAGLHGARIGALAAEGDAVAVVAEGGRLLLSQDGGGRFDPAAVPEGVAAADVALASGILWVRTRTGSLLSARPGRVLERCTVPGSVVSLAGDGAGGVVALAVDETGGPATLVRGSGTGAVACEAVQAPVGRPAALLSARGDHVAYVAASARGGVVVRRGDGSWHRLQWEGRVTALAIVDAQGTLVAATYSEADDTTGLVRIDGSGRASLVARLGPARDDAEADGRTLALAFDNPPGVVWVAGGFGVAAFAIR